MNDKKIKILIYGMQNLKGGVETYLYNFAKYCDYTKFSLTFLNTQKNGFMYEEELKKIGASVVKVTPSSENSKACEKELKKLMDEEKFDYFYINASSYNRFHFISGKVKPQMTKLLLHCHAIIRKEDIHFKSRVSHFIGKFIFNNSKILRVACGKDAGMYMFSNKPFEIFSNGIDVEKFKYNEEFRKEIRGEFGINDTDIVLGNIARLSKEKNHLFLLEVFSEILKLKPNSKLLLVGDGAEKDNIINKIKEMNIESKVILPGARSDAYKFYSALDGFVMPSIVEGFGISIAEAQANGLFCFGSDSLESATDLTGNVEYISLKKTAKEWAEIILKKLKRDSKALEKFSKEFKAEESYRKIFEYFEENLD